MTAYDGVIVVPETRLNASLAERLRTETRELHAAAERSAFMAALMAGRIERRAYRALLSNLHALYAVLEPALERHAGHPWIAPVFEPALSRTAALDADLRALGEDGVPAEPQGVAPATQTYLARLHVVDASQPGLLLAHAYVRYLGDLSGGQMLRDAVVRSARLGASAATAFYDFGDAQATRRLASAFRAGLAAVTADDASSTALVDEARYAFALHRQLFDELLHAG